MPRLHSMKISESIFKFVAGFLALPEQERDAAILQKYTLPPRRTMPRMNGMTNSGQGTVPNA